MSIKKAKISAYISAPLSVLTGFILAILLFLFVLKDSAPVPIFIIFATVQVFCMTLYAFLPAKGKTFVRMVSMFIIGMFIFALAGLMGKNNFQIEAFFFYVISGTMGGAIIHYGMAKIVGPLFFSRNWCSWGCWSAMVFDLLPYKKNIKWCSPKAGIFRYVHFVLSFILVATLYFGFKYTFLQTDPKLIAEGWGTDKELLWLLVGNLLYYASGIALAIKFKDNRAFCKYMCPVSVFLRMTNRITLLRIKGDAETCNNCGVCTSNCPMAIDIPAYIKAGTRVKSTECIMCMKCVASCPQANLKTSLGFDFAKEDKLV